MADFLKVLEEYPESILPTYRKKRTYLNQVLARNEVDANDAFSKKLFLRTDHGHYVLNPEMHILQNEEWVNVYDLMQTEKLGKWDMEKEVQKWREEFGNLVN